MVEFVLKLLKILGVEKAYLHDGTRIPCGQNDIDLSLFKLIEKDITFYQKFGFKFALDRYNDAQIQEYGSTEALNKALTETLSDFKKIETKYYVDSCKEIIKMLSQVMVNQDYENLDIYIHHIVKPYLVTEWNKPDMVREILQQRNNILAILRNSKQKYLRDVLIDTFYNNCDDYVALEALILDNLIYSIHYRKKKIIIKHINIFMLLRRIRNYSVFVIELN